MGRNLVIAALGALMCVATPSSPALAQTSTRCEPEFLLWGNAEASEMKHEWDGMTFSTYLVRNADRDSNEVLRPRILYEISSQRWGFDLRTPNDELLAAIRKEHVEDGGPGYNEWVIDPYQNHEQWCAGRRLTLKVGSRSHASVLLNGREIGTITNFPFHEAF